MGIIRVAILDGKLALWTQRFLSSPGPGKKQNDESCNQIIPVERIIKIDVGKISQWTGWFWLTIIYSADNGLKTIEVQVPNPQVFVDAIYGLKRESQWLNPKALDPN